MEEFSASAFARDGAHHFRAAFLSTLPEFEGALTGLARNKAGIRIGGCPTLAPLLAGDGPLGSIAGKALGKAARPVRAVLFDKFPANNWALGWHQDRTISVKERREVAGFGPWTKKA